MSKVTELDFSAVSTEVMYETPCAHGNGEVDDSFPLLSTLSQKHEKMELNLLYMSPLKHLYRQSAQRIHGSWSGVYAKVIDSKW